MIILMARNYIEQGICIAFMQRLNQYHPDIFEMIYHIKNESATGHVAGIGIKKGAPDYFLAMAKGGYHGLYFEMKKPKGRLSKDQLEFIPKLREQGYKVEVCYSWIEAVDACLVYCLD